VIGRQYVFDRNPTHISTQTGQSPHSSPGMTVISGNPLGNSNNSSQTFYPPPTTHHIQHK
jgi:hypothetical protein